MIAVVVALILWALVAGIQAYGAAEAGKKPAEAVVEVVPPGTDTLTITSKIMVAIHKEVGGELSMLGGRLSDLDRLATGIADKIRVAVVAAEMEDQQAGLVRIDAVLADLAELHADEDKDKSEAQLALLDTLTDDARAIRAILADGHPASLTDDQREGLIERHGWYARLALTMGDGADAGEREAVVGAGMKLLIALGGFGLFILSALLTGLVALVVVIVKMSTGRVVWRFRPPSPGGSVYLESFAVFVGAFLVLQVVLAGVQQLTSASTYSVVVLIAPWTLVLCALWPMVRGTSWSRLRADLGLERGKGVVREVLAGVFGYLAGLPVYALVFAITYFVNSIFSEGVGGGSNAINDAFASGNFLMIVLAFAIATSWAPLLEETIFRGGLYRHLRSRLGIVVAAIVGGIAFSFMHSYGVLMTPPLIMLAVTFSMLREWRGSLIAPMTAHFLHNFTGISIMLVLLFFTGS